MSNVIYLQPNTMLATINTALSSSYTCLPDAWLAYLQSELSSSSMDICQLEMLWLESVTSTTGAVIDLWQYYLATTLSKTGGLPDMLLQSILAGDLLVVTDGAEVSFNGDTVTFNGDTVIW